MDVFTGRARQHESTRSASLFASNIPLEVFDNLLATFERHLPTWHRYWQVRAKMIGVDTLEPFDLWAPLGAEPAQLTYEQCVDWVCDALEPLGDEYVETVRRGCLDERWIDVYPNQGKMGGAFSAGTPGTHPFIVMSFDGTAVSLGTLAHELGHSMHSYLAWKTQPQISARYSLFVAEVASNFHQALLRAHLLDVVDDENLELAILEEAMANFHRYFFIMPTLARFEREMHERIEQGEGLTADLLEERMAELFGEAYGPTSSSTASGSGSPGRSSRTCTRRSTSTSTRRGSPVRTRSRAACSPGRTGRRSATSASCPPAARSTRSTSCGRRAST